MKEVVVIGGAQGSSYSICKNIKQRYDVNVYLFFLNKNKDKLAKRSKYVSEIDVINAQTAEDFRLYFENWYALKNSSEKPILYCTSDEICIYIAKYIDWYNDKFLLTIPNKAIINNYTNKLLADYEARKNGLTLPKTTIIDSIPKIAEVEKEFSFPVIIKPFESSQVGDIGFKVKVFTSKEEFAVRSRELLDRFTFLCQEYIPGEDDKSWFYLFYRNQCGVIIDCIGKKTVQHPRGNGIMAMGETVSNNTLRDICHNFINTIDYQGIGGLEFKEFNGEYYFIEMNARIEAIISITDISIGSLPLLMYEDVNKISSKTDKVNHNQIDGKVYIDWIVYLIGVVQDKSIKDLLFLFKTAFTKQTIACPTLFKEYTEVIKTGFKKLFNIH